MTTDWTLDFFVPGTPVPQGSKNAIPIRNRKTRQIIKINQVESAPDLKPWRGTVTLAAQAAMAQAGLSVLPPKTQVSVECVFVFKRLAGAPKREIARTPMVVAPDVDKCLRAILDALTGPCYPDDGAVTRTVAVKCRAAPGEMTGVHIRVDRLPERTLT